MAKIENIVRIEIDPSKPVQEIFTVIMSVATNYYQGREAEILGGINEAIDQRLNQMKAGEGDGKPVLQHRRDAKDK